MPRYSWQTFPILLRNPGRETLVSTFISSLSNVHNVKVFIVLPKKYVLLQRLFFVFSMASI